MAFFIAGTDTGVGKTLLTAVLGAALLKRGMKTGIQKWITTGNGARSQDIDFITASMGKLLGQRLVENALFSAPCCLSLPASPHLAAEYDHVQIDIEHILSEYDRMKSLTDVLLVEGTGGIMVPVNRRLLFMDLLEQTRPMVILVARSGLGTINHTLLTLEVLRNKGIEVLCVILNPVDIFGNRDETRQIIVEDNRKIISELGRIDVFGPLPFVTDLDSPDMVTQVEKVADIIQGHL